MKREQPTKLQTAIISVRNYWRADEVGIYAEALKMTRSEYIKKALDNHLGPPPLALALANYPANDNKLPVFGLGGPMP